MSRARYLRKNATECERMLWRHLRNRNFANYKFRRQHPVDRYILDFYCPYHLNGKQGEQCSGERMRPRVLVSAPRRNKRGTAPEGRTPWEEKSAR
jgi:Protein of unknown function (DUF559)